MLVVAEVVVKFQIILLLVLVVLVAEELGLPFPALQLALREPQILVVVVAVVLEGQFLAHCLQVAQA